MNIAFAGLRHDHIFVLAKEIRENPATMLCGWWEADENARETAKILFPEPTYESYEALLADKNVQAVAIGDYYGIRGQRVIQALKAGKHVICDKPICTSLAELDEIEKLLDKTGLKLGCMLDLRYEPAFRHLALMVRKGMLAKSKPPPSPASIRSTGACARAGILRKASTEAPSMISLFTVWTLSAGSPATNGSGPYMPAHGTHLPIMCRISMTVRSA